MALLKDTLEWDETYHRYLRRLWSGNNWHIMFFNIFNTKEMLNASAHHEI